MPIGLLNYGLGTGGAQLLLRDFLGAGSAFPPVEPNRRRMLSPESPGVVGTFSPYTTPESDVATFDLTALLATAYDAEPAETITSIVEFSLTPVVTTDDATPAVRVQGTATVTGNFVSQRFGNWQTTVASIQYLVTALLETSNNDEIAVYGLVTVTLPPS